MVTPWLPATRWKWSDIVQRMIVHCASAVITSWSHSRGQLPRQHRTLAASEHGVVNCWSVLSYNEGPHNPCSACGHQSGPKQALKVPSTLFSILAFEDNNNCSKIRGSNGQLFNSCNRSNCDFFHPNLSLPICRHQHAKQVLKGDKKLPDNILFLPGANRLTWAGRQAFSDSGWLSDIQYV